MTAQSASFYSLLGDLSDVPPDYIRDVSHLKRFLERWAMDPKYQEAFASDAQAALTALGLSLTPADVIPLVDPAQAVTEFFSWPLGIDSWPLQVPRGWVTVTPPMDGWAGAAHGQKYGRRGGRGADPVSHVEWLGEEDSAGCTERSFILRRPAPVPGARARVLWTPQATAGAA